MLKTLPKRSEVREEVTWDLHSVYANDQAWEDAFQAASAAIPRLARFQGRLGESGATLLEALHERDALTIDVARVRLYAGMQAAGDSTDQIALGHVERAETLSARASESGAFFQPEILALGPER